MNLWCRVSLLSLSFVLLGQFCPCSLAFFALPRCWLLLTTCAGIFVFFDEDTSASQSSKRRSHDVVRCPKNKTDPHTLNSNCSDQDNTTHTFLVNQKIPTRFAKFDENSSRKFLDCAKTVHNIFFLWLSHHQIFEALTNRFPCCCRCVTYGIILYYLQPSETF